MIIFLYGTSSFGKTSISKEILQLVDNNFVHMEVDDALEEAPQVANESGRKVYIYNPGHIRLKNIIEKGRDVILDGFLTDEEFLEYIPPLSMSKTYIIKVHAPLETCVIRERLRGDRSIGSAAYFHNIIGCNFLKYDLLVDTSRLSPYKSALRILEYIKNTPSPSAFHNSKAKTL